jgi:hypothetical protein
MGVCCRGEVSRTYGRGEHDREGAKARRQTRRGDTEDRKRSRRTAGEGTGRTIEADLSATGIGW